MIQAQNNKIVVFKTLGAWVRKFRFCARKHRENSLFCWTRHFHCYVLLSHLVNGEWNWTMGPKHDERMLQNIFENKKKLSNMCLEQIGEHFHHLLWCLTTINLLILRVVFVVRPWAFSKIHIKGRRHASMAHFDPIIIRDR